MGKLTDRFLDRLGFVKKSSTLTWDELGRYFNTGTSQSSTLKTSKDYIDAYQLVSYVGKCVSRISYDIAALGYEIVDANNNLIENSKSSIILNKPNNSQGYNGFVSMMVMHLLLDGNIFVIPDQTNALALYSNQPNEIKVINPSLVEVYDEISRIIRAQDHVSGTRISRYDVRRSDGTTVSMFPDDIIHTKLTAPQNALRGMGIVQQNANLMDADRYSSIFNNAFYAQGAKSNVAIIPGNKLGIKEQKQFEDMIRDKYEGYNNWGKMMIMPNGTSVEPIDMNFKDMEFLEQKKMTREDIASFFDIPPLLSGQFNNVKYDTASEQIQVYQTITLPRYISIVEHSLSKIVERIEPQYRVKINKPFTKDPTKQAAILKDLFDRGGVTLNEYREMVGIDPVAENDRLESTFYMTVSYIPASMSGLQSTVSSSSDDKSYAIECDHSHDYKRIGPVTDISKPTSEQMRIHREMNRVKYGKEIETEYDVLEMTGGIYSKILKEVNSFYKEVGAQILSNLSKYTDIPNVKDIDDIDPMDISVQEARKSARKMFTSAAAVTVNTINKEFGTTIESSTRNVQFNLVVEKLSINYVDNTLNTSRAELKKIISNAIETGASMHDTRIAVEKLIGEYSEPNGWRAQRIARTETSNAWDAAAKIGYQEAGFTVFDVVGCIGGVKNGYDCLRANISIEEYDALLFPPNHTGSIVPRNNSLRG